MFKKTIFIIAGLILITSGFLLIGSFLGIKEANADTPSVVITSPNGGENIEIGKTYRIRFNSTILNDQYYISLLKNDSNYMQVMGGYSYSSGESYFDWSVPTGTVISPGNDYKIKIYNVSGTVQDTSDANFIVFSNMPAVTITTPNGGESMVRGRNYTIGWNVNWRPDITGNSTVNIYYQPTSGTNQLNQVIATGVSNKTATFGSYNWLVPNTLADGTYKIVVTAQGFGTNLSDESNASFNVLSGTLSVSLDPSTPVGKNIFAGSKNVQFLKFKVTNNYDKEVAIQDTSIILRGTAKPTDFDNIYWYDGPTLLGSSRFGTAGSAYGFTSISGVVDEQACSPNCKALFTIPAKSSKIITVSADISSSATGNASAAFSLLQDFYIFTSDRLPFIGTFPTTGNTMIIQSQSSSCTDSDNSNTQATWNNWYAGYTSQIDADNYVQGNVSGYENGVYKNYADQCIYYGGSYKLDERYCYDNNTKMGSRIINCPNGCEGGKCKPEKPDLIIKENPLFYSSWGGFSNVIVANVCNDGGNFVVPQYFNVEFKLSNTSTKATWVGYQGETFYKNTCKAVFVTASSLNITTSGTYGLTITVDSTSHVDESNELNNGNIGNVSINIGTGSIAVVSPASGNSYKVGDTVSVQWTMTGSVGPAGSVTVWLYRGSTPIATLKGADVATSNQWNWIISSNLGITQSGSDYKIRVISNSNTSIYGDSGYFTIAPATTTNKGYIIKRISGNSDQIVPVEYTPGASISDTCNVVGTSTTCAGLAQTSGSNAVSQCAIGSVGYVIFSSAECSKVTDPYNVLNLSVPEVSGMDVSLNGNTAPQACGTNDSTWCKQINPSANGDGPWEFNWGDGTKSCLWFPGKHTYNTANTYSIEVRVRNSCGYISARTSQSFTVKETTPGECLPDGTLIKIPTDPKIYVIKNCKKEWIQTADEFKQEGYKWEDVKEVNSAVIQAYNDYMEATNNLLRAIGQQKVYRVVNGKILWVPTIAAFNAQGLKWDDVQNVDESTINQYSRLKLVRASGDPKVYYLTEGGLKKWIPTVGVFNSYNNKWDEVVELTNKEISGYSDVVYIKLENDSRVYKIENGKKRWVKTEAAFNRLKIDWNNVSPVNQAEFDYYPEGAVIE